MQVGFVNISRRLLLSPCLWYSGGHVWAIISEICPCMPMGVYRMESSRVISCLSFVWTWLAIDSPCYLVGIYRDIVSLLGSVSIWSGRVCEDNSPHVLPVTVWWSAQAELMTLDSRTDKSSPRQTVGGAGAYFNGVLSNSAALGVHPNAVPLHGPTVALLLWDVVRNLNLTLLSQQVIIVDTTSFPPNAAKPCSYYPQRASSRSRRPAGRTSIFFWYSSPHMPPLSL